MSQFGPDNYKKTVKFQSEWISFMRAKQISLRGMGRRVPDVQRLKLNGKKNAIHNSQNYVHLASPLYYTTRKNVSRIFTLVQAKSI